MSIHDHDAERAVLGCVLSGEDFEAARALQPTDFHLPAHRHVWAAVQELFSSGQPVDEVTVAERLTAAGKLTESGGLPALMALTTAVHIAANLASYVATVRDRSLRRAVIEECRRTALAASRLDEDAAGVALRGSDAFAQLGAAGASSLRTMADCLQDYCDELQQIASGAVEPCLKTGVDVFDEVLGGLQLGRLTLVGAQPSVGKSALKNRIMFNLAQAGVRCGNFELEDPVSATIRRGVASGSGVPVRRLASERLPEYLMHSVGEAISRMHEPFSRIWVEDRSSLTDVQLATIARQMVVQHGVKAIFVDNASEITFTANLGRHDLNVAQGVRYLRNVAKDLNVAVVLLVHFHRPKDSSKEARNIRPTSTMWKESGAFEGMARVALALWEDVDLQGGVVGTVLKQTEGAKDFDFWMPLDGPAGLIESKGGRKRDGVLGYSQPEAA